MNGMRDTPGIVDIMGRIKGRQRDLKNIDVCSFFREWSRMRRDSKKPKKDQKNFQKGLA